MEVAEEGGGAAEDAAAAAAAAAAAEEEEEAEGGRGRGRRVEVEGRRRRVARGVVVWGAIELLLRMKLESKLQKWMARNGQRRGRGEKKDGFSQGFFFFSDPFPPSPPRFQLIFYYFAYAYRTDDDIQDYTCTRRDLRRLSHTPTPAPPPRTSRPRP